jgi:hypothetical protein
MALTATSGLSWSFSAMAVRPRPLANAVLKILGARAAKGVAAFRCHNPARVATPIADRRAGP